MSCRVGGRNEDGSLAAECKDLQEAVTSPSRDHVQVCYFVVIVNVFKVIYLVVIYFKALIRASNSLYKLASSLDRCLTKTLPF